MTKRYALAISLASLLLVAIAEGRSGRVNALEGTGAPAIGSTIADFKLTDASGKEQSLASLKGAHGTVLVFISAQCPVVRDYGQRIAKLADDYKARGINVVGINANSTESVEEMKAHAAANNFHFAVLKDNGNKVADMLGAQRTPEVFLLDAANKLVYHGRIDNNRTLSLVNANDLRDAIDAVLAGKPVVKTEASAFGCSIKRAS